MNRERAKELLPIIQAFANGENIEFRVQADKECGSDVWTPIPSTGISLQRHVEYRIKPKPREWEVLVDNFGYILTIRQDGEGERDWIKVREIL